MFPLFETIQVSNNQLVNIAYHNNRVNYSRKTYFSSNNEWNLAQLITIPALDPKLKYRCRFVYNETRFEYEFFEYTMRKIESFQLVTVNDADYSLKYTNRQWLDNLKATHNQTDDLIIVKNGLVTDCTYANLIFRDGDKWVTPNTPLLKGTRRQFYIDQNRIEEKTIKVEDLNKFTSIKIINAMIGIDDCPEIPITNILF